MQISRPAHGVRSSRNSSSSSHRLWVGGQQRRGTNYAAVTVSRSLCMSAAQPRAAAHAQRRVQGSPRLASRVQAVSGLSGECAALWPSLKCFLASYADVDAARMRSCNLNWTVGGGSSSSSRISRVTVHQEGSCTPRVIRRRAWWVHTQACH